MIVQYKPQRRDRANFVVGNGNDQGRRSDFGDVITSVLPLGSRMMLLKSLVAEKLDFTIVIGQHVETMRRQEVRIAMVIAGQHPGCAMDDKVAVDGTALRHADMPMEHSAIGAADRHGFAMRGEKGGSRSYHSYEDSAGASL